MQLLQFPDHMVSYETFVHDISASVVKMLKSDNDDPEFVSQSRAYKMFGRRNVQRWKAQGKIVPCKRPGRVEYNTAELRLLQRVTQDYYQ